METSLSVWKTSRNPNSSIPFLMDRNIPENCKNFPKDLMKIPTVLAEDERDWYNVP